MINKNYFTMNDKKVLAPIRYFELDGRVNYANHLEVSIKVKIDEHFINSICDEFTDTSISFEKWFENVTTIPEYSKQLNYFTNLWIEKIFYENIEQHLSKYKMEKHAGNICFLLLCIKKIDTKRQLYKVQDEKLQMNSEFGRFLDFILKYRNTDKLVSEIEFTKSSVVETFKHGDFILKNLLKLIDERFDDDLIGWMKLHHKFRYVDEATDTKPSIRDFDAYFKRYIFTKLESISLPLIPSISKRSFLYNQILAEAGISDFEAFNIKPDHPKYKINRARVIDRTRKEINYKLRTKK